MRRNTHGARFCTEALSGIALLNGGFHSFEDWDLVPTKPLSVKPAQDATPTVKIDGAVDRPTLRLTGLTGGDPVFADCNGSWEFMVRRQSHWPILRDKMVNYLQGRDVRVVLDDDRAHFYFGTVSVDEWEPGDGRSAVRMQYNFRPYKLEISSTVEPWPWSPFRFPDGVIRKPENYVAIAVSGTVTLDLIGSSMPVVPTFISTGTVSVTFGGVTTALTAGVRTAIPSIVIRNRTYSLTFTGSGTVTVEYRGGRL